tara:strand:+ start:4107 stop:4280 length:174 start_codon:yes stop_codon:yes gene_type:complete
VERIIETITLNENISIVVGRKLQQPANLPIDKKDWIPKKFTNVWLLAAKQSSTFDAG